MHDHGSSATTGEAADAVPQSIEQLVTLELKRYPARLLQRMALFEVIVCESLKVNGDPRLMTLNLVSGTLYIDCKLLMTSRDLATRIFHHELFHLIDYRDDGEVYSDDEWLRLNPRDFTYLHRQSVAAERYGSITEPITSQPGILSGYSAVAMEEDKAELFSFMVVDPKVVERRCAQDSVVAAKAGRIKAILNSFGSGTAKDLLGTE